MMDATATRASAASVGSSPFNLLRQQSANSYNSTTARTTLAPSFAKIATTPSNSSSSSSSAAATPSSSQTSVALAAAAAVAATAAKAEAAAVATAELINTLQSTIIRLTDENRQLIQEKTTWLTRMQADNHKLGLLFQDVNEAKKRLVREIDNIQTEKSRLKAHSISIQEENLDKIVGGSGSLLAPSARKLLPLDKRVLAGEVYEKMVQRITQCRENQVQVFQVITEKAKQVEAGFKASTPDGTEKMESALEALKNIASVLPGNLHAAEAVASCLSETMVFALLEKSGAILAKREAAIRAEDELETSSALLGIGSGSTSSAAVAVELKKLRAENDSLKRKILDMKKQHTAQIMKVAEVAKTANGRPNSPKASSDEEDRFSARSEAASEPFVRFGATVNMENDFKDLPEAVKLTALKVISVHILQTLKGNPLSSGMKEVVLLETANEIASQIADLVGGALRAFSTQGEVDLKNSKSVEATVAKVLSSPILFQEISSHTTLSLIYLCSRFGFPPAVDVPKAPPPATQPSARTNPVSVSSKSPQNPEGDDKPEYYDQYHNQARQAANVATKKTVAAAKPKANVNGVFASATAGATLVNSDQQFSLRPQAKASAAAKGVPSFMQPVPKRR